MEKGRFKDGDKFKRQSDGKEIVIVFPRLRYMGGNPVEVAAVTEAWDVINEFEIDDWVCHEEDVLIGKVTKKDGRYVSTDNMREGLAAYWDDGLRKATAEEIVQEKRRRMFSKGGRDLDEFKNGDIVTPLDNDKLLLIVIKYYKDKNAVLIDGELFDATSVNPVYFVESMVKKEG
ncbi:MULTISPECIES: hypothetical protein [Bacillus cereus group]|nr:MULTISPECIES: hypothetical protein [Bacillus cereus group]MCC2402920.1 hypothetical protein [Bacillus paranthracis]MCU5005739.1 hypothetical protein [Bacillus pacificus]MCU5126576.1 hypothetical protein [Bacillus paranthracis]HDR3634680.1 hypothetical protein [Bacillus pacificus]HDR7653463.1 hypothetical protein [Bacillus pacificus]